MTSGHIKLVKGAEDPDPSEYLLPSIDMKRKDGKKPSYNRKESVRIPCPKTGGYMEGLVEFGTWKTPPSVWLLSLTRSTASGKLNGCDIVSYMLEKSRITEQQEVERSNHIGGGLRNICRIPEDFYISDN